jgi:hypothetical protein
MTNAGRRGGSSDDEVIGGMANTPPRPASGKAGWPPQWRVEIEVVEKALKASKPPSPASGAWRRSLASSVEGAAGENQPSSRAV